MSDKLKTVEKSVEEILINIMAEKVMSAGIQASSTQGVQASSSTACGYGPSRATIEKRTKHRDDLANAKLIPSILANYILSLVSAVSHESVPRDFEYTLITAYLSKGIHTVKPQLDKILMLNISDFNLGDRKNYNMLAPHKYLTRKKGKKSNINPQPWTMDIVSSTILNIIKIPHFGKHQEVNACVKLLLSCFHGGYLWLDRCITVDLELIHRITELSMQGPDPQEFSPGKAADCALAQKIKDTYGDVENGKRGYKEASIQNDAVRIAYQLIVGKLVRKKRPTQVIGFVVDLKGKCVEGIQMNWVSYLINQLEKDCREAWDQGYEFHFSWLLIPIMFIVWEMSEGVTFPEIEPSERLAVKFNTL
jgi:hypothetical protein